MNAAISTRKRKTNKKTIGRWLKVITHIGALLPLAWLLWHYFQNDLGTDPVRTIILKTGITTLTLLMLSLAVTPLNKLFGWKQIIPLRKLLGLYAFLYVSLHLLTFVWLDYGLNLKFIWDGIAEQPYVVVGFTAFLLLIPLAATSTKWAMRRLGKNWKRLHKLVYLIGALGILHFYWLGKVHTRAIVYGSVMALLLLTRVGPVNRQLVRWRSQIKKWTRSLRTAQ
jgi:sulfoxide reductase heme-binding subunit YedZ